VDNLWVQPLDGSARRQLTHFTSEKIGGFGYSKDGNRGSQLGAPRGFPTRSFCAIFPVKITKRLPIRARV